MRLLLNLLFIFLLIRFIWIYWVRPLFISEAELRRQRQQRAERHHRLAQQRYLACLMPLIARMAKIDGAISVAEIDFVEVLFRNMGLSAGERETAIAIFKRTKDDPAAFEEALVQFTLSGYSFEVRFATFQTLIQVAMVDHHGLTPAKRTLLLRVASAFNLPPPLVNLLMGQVYGGAYHSTRGDAYQGRHASTRPSMSTREEDLALFGLSSSATANDIKKAYRQKVKELHPDRLQAQGLPESMIKEATQRMTVINAAYDRLMK